MSGVRKQPLTLGHFYWTESGHMTLPPRKGCWDTQYNCASGRKGNSIPFRNQQSAYSSLKLYIWITSPVGN